MKLFQPLNVAGMLIPNRVMVIGTGPWFQIENRYVNVNPL